jgi:hypothetical protein
MPLPPECMKKGHPSYGGGRPRTAIPEKEELIELGKDLVEWASEKPKKGDRIRARFCDWYTDRGFVRKQWEHMREKPEFQWYYETARSYLAEKYVDGTVNASIAHRYLRIYDPELRDEENKDAEDNELRKAAALKGEARAIEQEKQKVLEEVQRNKRVPQ